MKTILTFSLMFLTQCLFAQIFTKKLGTPFEGIASSSASFTDVNGDNAPDVFITGLNSSLEYIAELYLNDGITSINNLSRQSGISSTLTSNPVASSIVNITVNTEQSSRVRISLFDVLGQQLRQQEELLILLYRN